MKLAIITVMPSFLNNFIKKFKEEGNEVDFYSPGQDQNLNIWKLRELCDWADVIWCEFCQHPMALVTNYVKDKPIIARLWRCEMYNPKYLDQIRWDSVDLLLIATDSLKERFLKSRTEKLEPKITKSFYMPSVNMQEFKYVERKYEEKHKICIVGNILPRKRQLDAVQLMLDLPKNFTLSIAGEFKDREYTTHIQNFIKGNDLAGRVEVYGHINHAVLPDFFGDHDVYLSMSAEETAHFAAAEAMSTGCYPVLNWWPGISMAYPDLTIHRSFSSLVSAIQKWNKQDSETKKSTAEKIKGYAEEHFSSEIEYKTLMEDLKSVLV
jgi:glycosyltransferase involved in cell wall biosynthesis